MANLSGNTLNGVSEQPNRCSTIELNAVKLNSVGSFGAPVNETKVAVATSVGDGKRELKPVLPSGANKVSFLEYVEVSTGDSSDGCGGNGGLLSACPLDSTQPQAQLPLSSHSSSIVVNQFSVPSHRHNSHSTQRFHYEPLRPPADVSESSLEVMASSTNHNSTPSSLPMVSFEPSLALMQSNSCASSYTLPVMNLSFDTMDVSSASMSSSSSSPAPPPPPPLPQSMSTNCNPLMPYSIYTGEYSNHAQTHMLPNYQSIHQPLVQYWSNEQPPLIPSDSIYNTGNQNLLELRLQTDQSSNIQLNQSANNDPTLISKSSSSDSSDTNDSTTRLIGDSIQDIVIGDVPLGSNTGSSSSCSSGSGAGVGSAQQQSHQPHVYHLMHNNSHHPHLRCPSVNQLYSSGRVSSPLSSTTIDTILEQVPGGAEENEDNAQMSTGPPSLWIPMQSGLSEELRENYLNSVASDSGSIKPIPSKHKPKINSTIKKKFDNKKGKRKKKKSDFVFRRIGNEKCGFVCPLRKSTSQYLCIANGLLVGLVAVVLLVAYCYQHQLLMFANWRSYSSHTTDQDQFWYDGTTFYEIFPASFKDTDGDGYGDLNGITENVHYLRSLGISAIRLNSIFSALDYPQRYDNVLNFFAIDPHLGKFPDFLQMIETLHRNHIRVILDINPTVTSDQHPWAAHWLMNRTGEYANFYVPSSPSLTGERFNSNSTPFPTLTSIDANDLSSMRHSHLEESQLYFGSSLRLNWSHEAVQNQILKVADFWLRHVDGLYLKNLHNIHVDKHDSRERCLHSFLQRLRRIVTYHEQFKSNSKPSDLVSMSSKKILICSSSLLQQYWYGVKRRRQTNKPTVTQKSVSRQLKPDLFELVHIDDDAVDDYHQSYWNEPNGENSAKQPNILVNHHVMPQANYDRNNGSNKSLPSNPSSSFTPLLSTKTATLANSVHQKALYSYFDLMHFELKLEPNQTDTIRDQVNYVFLNRPSSDFPTILWSVGSVHQSRLANRVGEPATLATMFLLSMMPGTVSLFYGDEIGLNDVYDLHTNNVFRGGQLGPMSWSSISPNGNFSLVNVSSHQLWLPVHPNYPNVNVEKRSSMIKLVSDLIHFRLDHLYGDLYYERTPSRKPASSSNGKTVSPSPKRANTRINYLFHYIDSSVVVMEQYFDRKSDDSVQFDNLFDLDYGQSIGGGGGDGGSNGGDSDLLNSNPNNIATKRYRYVLFANFANQTVVKDFSDKFHFSLTQLATNVNRTSEFLIMKSLKLYPGEAVIVTVE